MDARAAVYVFSENQTSLRLLKRIARRTIRHLMDCGQGGS